MSSPTVHILNGPNISMTGLRDPTHYGALNYDQICQRLVQDGEALGLAVKIRQSNYEGELVGWIHEIAREETPLIINAGAYTHTSVALLDALQIVRAPKVEVHMSNVHAREPFRQRSFVSPAVDGIVIGFGIDSYRLALRWVAERLSD